jgi:PAS domain S-box-containing protein
VAVVLLPAALLPVVLLPAALLPVALLPVVLLPVVLLPVVLLPAALRPVALRRTRSEKPPQLRASGDTYNLSYMSPVAAAMFRWNLHALPWAVLAAVLLALAVIIYRRQRASRVAVLFCAMIVLVAIWFFGFAGMFLAVRRNVADDFARLAIAGVCLLPAAIYDFTITALRLQRRWPKRAIRATSVVFALLTLVTHSVVRLPLPHRWGWYPAAGPLLPLFLVFFVGALVAQLVEGIREQRQTRDAKRRRRLVELLASFIVVYFAAVDFVPMFGVDTQPVGYVPVAAFMVVAWTSIQRHRLPPITAARAAREILDTMADALFVIDDQARIRVVNGAVRPLLGFRPNELLGKSIDTLEQTFGDETISRTLRELARRGAIRDQERVLRHSDGHTIDVSVSISPILDREKQAGAVVIARDIRERKRAEEEVHLFMRRLEQSNRELEDFAYVASHDLQEPLRKIQAFGDRLKAKYAAELPVQGRDYVERMQSAANRMQVLINDLLSFSRVTTKAQPFVHVDLGEIARAVAHDLEIRAHDVGGQIVIRDLPSIDADPMQMRQLLQNLTANGLKFHRDDAPPVVEISGFVSDGHARIAVSDNGIGFDPKYADRIFTMFERLHARGKYEGTGIGLAICRKIAERHGGEIAAESRPGEGSTFTITLPVTHAHEEGGRT